MELMSTQFLIGLSMVIFGLFVLHPGLGCIAGGLLMMMWGMAETSPSPPPQESERADDAASHD